MTTTTAQRANGRARTAPAPARRSPARGQARKPDERRAAPARTERTQPVAHAVLAAEGAVRRNSVHARLPLVGSLRLPAAEELAFIGGVAALAVIGVVDWPIALLLGIGHTLATSRRNKVVQAFGEAMAEA